MRRLVFVVLITLAATPTVADVATGAPPAASEWSKLDHSLPKSVWGLNADGALIHLESGLVCPTTLAGYRRMSPTTYDGLGLDVSCDYQTEGKHITLYLTLTHGAPPDALLSQAQGDLMQVGGAFHPVLLSRRSERLGGLDWLTARYAEDGARLSDIWMSDLYGWTFEYRATYDAARRVEVEADIAAMTSQVQASAGATLRRCTAGPIPLRNGIAVTGDKILEEMAMMTAVMAAGARAAASAGKAEVVPDTATWCMEGVVRDPARPMLLWRAVGEDGADAHRDRLTLASDEGPPILLSAGDDLAAMIDKKAVNRWTISLTSGGRTRVFAYFTGRPPVDQLSSLFSGIVTGAAKALIGYGVNGRNINIETPGKP